LPVIIRRTRVRSDRISPETITAADIAAGAIKIAEVAPKSVARPHLTYLEQFGSAKPGAGGYVAFPTAYSVAPYVVVSMKDRWDPSATYGPAVTRVVTGSFVAYGSPAGYIWWRSIGSA